MGFRAVGACLFARAPVRAEAADGGAGVATVVVPPADVVLPYVFRSAAGTDTSETHKHASICTCLLLLLAHWQVNQPFSTVPLAKCIGQARRRQQQSLGTAPVSAVVALSVLLASLSTGAGAVAAAALVAFSDGIAAVTDSSSSDCNDMHTVAEH